MASKYHEMEKMLAVDIIQKLREWNVGNFEVEGNAVPVPKNNKLPATFFLPDNHTWVKLSVLKGLFKSFIEQLDSHKLRECSILRNLNTIITERKAFNNKFPQKNFEQKRRYLQHVVFVHELQKIQGDLAEPFHNACVTETDSAPTPRARREWDHLESDLPPIVKKTPPRPKFQRKPRSASKTFPKEVPTEPQPVDWEEEVRLNQAAAGPAVAEKEDILTYIDKNIGQLALTYEIRDSQKKLKKSPTTLKDTSKNTQNQYLNHDVDYIQLAIEKLTAFNAALEPQVKLLYDKFVKIVKDPKREIYTISDNKGKVIISKMVEKVTAASIFTYEGHEYSPLQEFPLKLQAGPRTQPKGVISLLDPLWWCAYIEDILEIHTLAFCPLEYYEMRKEPLDLTKRAVIEELRGDNEVTNHPLNIGRGRELLKLAHRYHNIFRMYKDHLNRIRGSYANYIERLIENEFCFQFGIGDPNEAGIADAKKELESLKSWDKLIGEIESPYKLVDEYYFDRNLIVLGWAIKTAQIAIESTKGFFGDNTIL